MQFAATTLEDAKQLYEIGLLNSVGLTYFYFQIKLKEGWEQSFDPKEICKELGVSKASFYRALSICRVHGILEFEATGKIKVKNLKASPDKSCLKTETGSLKTETEASKLRQDSQNSDKNLKTETATPPKPPSFKASSPPSYSSQINSNSVKVSQIQKDDDDDDDFNSWLKKKLGEMSVNNPSAYLNARDKNTGLTVLEVLHKEYGSQPDENAPKTPSAPSAWQKVLGLSAKLQFGQRTNQLISPNDEPRLYQSVMAIGGLGKISAADPIYDHPKLKAGFIEFYKNFSDN